MPTCFVMQPFDGGTFDGRYDQVFKAETWQISRFQRSQKITGFP